MRLGCSPLLRPPHDFVQLAAQMLLDPVFIFVLVVHTTASFASFPHAFSFGGVLLSPALECPLASATN
jgi:hypothetical protein